MAILYKRPNGGFGEVKNTRKMRLPKITTSTGSFIPVEFERVAIFDEEFIAVENGEKTYLNPINNVEFVDCYAVLIDPKNGNEPYIKFVPVEETIQTI